MEERGKVGCKEMEEEGVDRRKIEGRGGIDKKKRRKRGKARDKGEGGREEIQG